MVGTYPWKLFIWDVNFVIKIWACDCWKLFLRYLLGVSDMFEEAVVERQFCFVAFLTDHFRRIFLNCLLVKMWRCIADRNLIYLNIELFLHRVSLTPSNPGDVPYNPSIPSLALRKGSEPDAGPDMWTGGTRRHNQPQDDSISGHFLVQSLRPKISTFPSVNAVTADKLDMRTKRRLYSHQLPEPSQLLEQLSGQKLDAPNLRVATKCLAGTEDHWAGTLGHLGS